MGARVRAASDCARLLHRRHVDGGLEDRHEQHRRTRAQTTTTTSWIINTEVVVERTTSSFPTPAVIAAAPPAVPDRASAHPPESSDGGDSDVFLDASSDGARQGRFRSLPPSAALQFHFFLNIKMHNLEK